MSEAQTTSRQKKDTKSNYKHMTPPIPYKKPLADIYGKSRSTRYATPIQVAPKKATT